MLMVCICTCNATQENFSKLYRNHHATCSLTKEGAMEERKERGKVACTMTGDKSSPR